MGKMSRDGICFGTVSSTVHQGIQTIKAGCIGNYQCYMMIAKLSSIYKLTLWKETITFIINQEKN